MEYKYAIEGYDKDPDCPLYTNCVRTEFGVLAVSKRFEKQGLNVIVRTVEKMKGLNPYWEKEL